MLNLIAEVGHMQLRMEDFVPQLRVLRLSDRNLAWVDVSQFVGLQLLDLSSNRLKGVQGLECCQQLRLLNLSKNVALDLDALAQTVSAKDKALTKLENIS